MDEQEDLMAHSTLGKLWEICNRNGQYLEANELARVVSYFNEERLAYATRIIELLTNNPNHYGYWNNSYEEGAPKDEERCREVLGN